MSIVVGLLFRSFTNFTSKLVTYKTRGFLYNTLMIHSSLHTLVMDLNLVGLAHTVLAFAKRLDVNIIVGVVTLLDELDGRYVAGSWIYHETVSYPDLLFPNLFLQ